MISFRKGITKAVRVGIYSAGHDKHPKCFYERPHPTL